MFVLCLNNINMDNISMTVNMLILSTCVQIAILQTPKKLGHRSCSQEFGQIGVHFLEEGPAPLGTNAQHPNPEIQIFILSF